MILAMMVGYIVILHLIFNVFQLVKASTRNKLYVTVLGCFLIYCVLLFINFFQPMSTDLRVMRAVIPLRTRVLGTVIEVAAKPNVPIKKGDVIFRIDPKPFEANVNRLRAALVEAEQQAKMLPVEVAAAEAAVSQAEAALVDAKQQAESLGLALDSAKANVEKFQAQEQLATEKFERQKQLQRGNATSEEDVQEAERTLTVAKAAVRQAVAQRESAQLAFDANIGGVNTIIVRAQETVERARADRDRAKLALESVINGENATVARIRAELAAAEIDLADTVVRAPTDGFVTNLSLRPGQNIIARESGVASFVSTEEYAILATFHQQVLGVIKPGDEAELAMDDLPGRTLRATVKNINRGIPQGQVVASGELLDTTPLPHGRFIVQFTLEDASGLDLPAGEAGAVAIYTSHGRMWVPVRKVFFRWYTWLNYIITDMDVVGPRE